MSDRPAFAAYLERLPLVAILRGIAPEEAAETAQMLVDEGFTIIEVPMSSPRPLDSIAAVAEAVGDRALVGAGTVLRPAQVTEIAAAGGRLIVMPHCDVRVLMIAIDAGLAVAPGVQTPTEAFTALECGADAIKLFPAEACPPPVVKALRAVLPADALVVPVGGITPASLAPYRAAGANGFGIGSALYRPGKPAAEVRAAARRFVAAARALPA